MCVDPLNHICSNTFSYTSGSPYEKNLNTLLNQLNVKVPPTGFGQSSVGHNQDTVYGLALCRGDISNEDCKSFVDVACKDIIHRSPNDKGTVIWYDGCLLRYSNISLLGTIDSANKFYLYNVRNVTDVESFNQNNNKFLSRLSSEAYKTSRLFTTGETSLSEVDTLYGLVQCTRDLSSIQCNKCLDDAINQLPNCCDGRRGGKRVVGASCNFRYELYPFISS